MKYQLQQYEDGTFGYLGIDGNETYKFQNDSRVICTQEEDEDREEFISKNDITFSKNQYGSNEILDEQVNDNNYRVRCKVVSHQGYGLDKLIYDEDVYVRVAVARQGYGLDKLINDEHGGVRSAVAEQGYGLDKLINDENYNVRCAVAYQGYGLDKLVKDEHCLVRVAVASQGYGLEVLVKDEDVYVREAVKDYLENDIILEKRKNIETNNQ